MKTLVIIPAYNEEESIVKTVNTLEACIDAQDEYEIDYIVINDGSYDKTEQVMIDNNIKYITHIVNLGVGAAIKTGIVYSEMYDYDNVTQYDADGQHNPEFIVPLIKGVEEGYDVVIGSRFVDGKKHWSLRMLGSKILSNLIWVKSGFRQKITDPTSGQRIISRKVKSVYMKDAASSEPSFAIKYYRQGFKVKEIPVLMNDREAGESHFNALNSIKFMLEQTLAIVFGF
jgi:glycosyltransferase involved in cell wall biosynthesis